MNTNNFTQELLNALDHARPIKAPSSLYKKMEQVALSTINHKLSFSKQTVLAIAASFLLLLSANVVLINMNLNRLETTSDELTSSYDLVPTKSLYHE